MRDPKPLPLNREILLGLLIACVGASPVLAVRITEILYHPPTGRGVEFVEIFNEEPQALDLTGYHLCGGVSFTFDERTFLEPGGYLVIAADADALRALHGIDNVVGDFQGSLDNGGEEVALCDNAGVVRARVEYNDRGRWPGSADGAGHSLELRNVFGAPADVENWSASSFVGGSPGLLRPSVDMGPDVVLNELAAVVLDKQERWIELYNGSETEVDLTGYFLSTDSERLDLAPLPSGSVIQAGGFLTFNESELGLRLAASSPGEKLLVALTAPTLDRVIDARNFRPLESDVTEARFPDGARRFSPAAEPTPNAPNHVVVADVVINELHYHPIDDDSQKEFIEIYNRGDGEVNLTDWEFTDGVQFSFPTTVLPAHGYLVITPNPELLGQRYGLPSAVVVGPTTADARAAFGRLANEGERVTLRDERGNIIDTVRYFDGGSWPHWPDGGGSTLELVDARQSNDFGGAWDASDDSHRAAVTEISYRGRYHYGEPEFHIVLPERGIVLVDDVAMTQQLIEVIGMESLIASSQPWSYFKGSQAPPPDWAAVDFDAEGWPVGLPPFGYGAGDKGTRFVDMRGNYPAVFFRIDFDIEDPDGDPDLALTLEFDDGYVAYLNGVEVARSNLAAGAIRHDALALTRRDEAYDVISLRDAPTRLRRGTNVLAVQVHNENIASSDFHFRAQLVRGTIVESQGPNLLTDGGFEGSDFTTCWRPLGTHATSERIFTEPLNGRSSLRLVATGNGDNKANHLETTAAGFGLLERDRDYEVSLRARWVVGAATLLTHGHYGATLPNFAAAHELALPDRFGTPGERNSATAARMIGGRANLGPLITSVRHDPAVPAAGESVIVTAQVNDSDTVESVSLLYAVDRPLPRGDPGWHEVVLHSIDDTVYQGEIPGHSDGAVVLFYLIACDALGGTSRFPLDRRTRTHPVRASETSSWDDRYALFRHDDRHTGGLHSYRAIFHADMEEKLALQPLQSNEGIDATFVFDNRDIYYNTRVRFGGSPLARKRWQSWRVRMPPDRPLHGEWEKFALENHAPLAKERISHYLLRFNQGATRVPYSTAWLVQWRVGGREPVVREHVNYPTRAFLKKWYPDDRDGAFFEMDSRYAVSDTGVQVGHLDAHLRFPPYGDADDGTNKELYRYFYQPRGRDPFDRFEELIDLAYLMTPGLVSDSEFDKQIWQSVDVEEFLRVWAIRLNTDDWDTWGTRRGRNCYFYRQPRRSAWTILAWDMENTYGEIHSFLPPAIAPGRPASYDLPFVEVARFINRPRVMRLYYSILQELIDGPFRSEFLAPYMARLAQAGHSETEIGLPGGFVDQRRALLQERLAGATREAVDFTVSSVRATFAAGEPVEFVGIAPIDVRTVGVTVDDVATEEIATEFSDTDVFGWRAVGRLPSGTYEVKFFGYDHRHELVGRAHVVVTVAAPARFLRGDPNLSSGVDVSDAVTILRYLFGSSPLPCISAADVDDGGTVDVDDAMTILRYLFDSGGQLAEPFPTPGIDPTLDLGCAAGLAE